jgi:uncharacterized membrane protein/mono/diheme cytochrome c family protein
MIPAFLGRMHPLLLHVPIGIYVLLFLLQYVFRRTSERDGLLSVSLLTGFITSSLTAGLGWTLALEGDHAGDTVEWHRWTGIAFAACSGLLWFIHGRVWAGRLSPKVYHACFAFTMLLMTAAGHFGGELTHGKGYLFGEDSSSGQVPTGTPRDTATIFHMTVMPVLRSKCVQCHKPGKMKGGLRMDDPGMLMRGGKHGAVIRPGDPSGSEMMMRILLPADDEKHMPPKGKPQLTGEEVALLQWWIRNGAGLSAPLPAGAAVNDTLKPFLAGVRNTSPAAAPPEPELPKVRVPDSVTVSAVRKKGWSVNPVSMGSPLLEVSAINMTALTDADIASLMPIAENIYLLDLSGTGLTDLSMASLSRCVNLRRLSLKATRVGSAGIGKLEPLQQLEYLNLVGTGIDDACLPPLAQMKGLKKVYAWNTSLSSAAAGSHMQRHPGMTIETGMK